MLYEVIMKNIVLAIVLIMLVFMASCNDKHSSNDEPSDIYDLNWKLSIIGTSGESVDTIITGSTVTLMLEIINDTLEDIEITYEHCTPYDFRIYMGEELIWESDAADCWYLDNECIEAGSKLVFTEEFTAVQWNTDEQQYYDLPPGKYTFQAKFSGTSVINADLNLTIDETLDFDNNPSSSTTEPNYSSNSTVDTNNSGSSKLNTYIDLRYAEFMNESYYSIAENLAGILGVAPVFFNQNLLGDIRGSALGDNKWIKEGYEYTTANGAYITVWVDHDDQPYIITYLLRRFGALDGLLYDQDEANSKIQTVLEQMGIRFDGTEDLKSGGLSFGVFHIKWYEIKFQQTFQNDSLAYPYIYAEVEGNTGEINFLKIHRWYYNLREITAFLPDDKLIEIAIDYYESRDAYRFLRENITCYGYYIVNEVLCKKVGKAKTGQWGSEVYVFIDIQNGEIVDTEIIAFG